MPWLQAIAWIPCNGAIPSTKNQWPWKAHIKRGAKVGGFIKFHSPAPVNTPLTSSYSHVVTVIDYPLGTARQTCRQEKKHKNEGWNCGRYRISQCITAIFWQYWMVYSILDTTDNRYKPSNFGYLIVGNMFILGISTIVESQLGIQARNTKKLGHTLDNAV